LSGPRLRLSQCALAVHDLDRALGFYRDVLGFEVRDDVEAGGTRWVSVGPPAQPDLRILLGSPGADPGVPPADRRAIEDLLAKGLLGRLVFVTDDCDATFRLLEAAGAEVMQEPISRPDGARDCAFLDPSGNLVRFTQPRPDR
jgi:catechol 2,3-dioxygenase-like lactoylglutathione lyase family enzyme